MRPVTALLLLAAALFASPALAQDSGTYAGVSYVWANYSADGFPHASPSALSFRIGKELTRNLAVEARAGFNVGSDTVTYQGQPVDVELVKAFSVYAKAILPVSEGFAVYALAGVVGGRLSATGPGSKVSQSNSGVSLGAGLDLALDKHWGLALEWAQLFSGADYQVDAASFGLTYRY